MTLLYAEDELNILKQYSNYFKNYFLHVYTAVDGKQALSLYRDKKPDVAILDINMPFLNGLEVAKKMRIDNSDICIILLTARSDKRAFLEAVELDLTTYLEKPMKRDELKQALVKLSQKIKSKNSINLWLYDDSYYTWDKKQEKLFYNQHHISLTKQETILLALLISRDGAKINYQEIYESIWFDEDREYKESTIKTLISTLRIKLPQNAIKNIYGMGYYLNFY